MGLPLQLVTEWKQTELYKIKTTLIIDCNTKPIINNPVPCGCALQHAGSLWGTVWQHLASQHPTALFDSCGNQGAKIPQLAKMLITQSKEGNPHILMLQRFPIHRPVGAIGPTAGFLVHLTWMKMLTPGHWNGEPSESPHFPQREATIPE